MRTRTVLAVVLLVLLTACGSSASGVVTNAATSVAIPTDAPGPESTPDTASIPVPTESTEPESQPVAQLVVQVRDAVSGQPAANARVVVFQMNAYYSKEQTTGANGQIAFPDLLALGTTMVTVHADGYEISKTSLEIIAGENMLGVDLVRSGDDPSTSAARGWIDMHVHLNPDLCVESLCGIDLLVSNMDTAGVDRVVLFPLQDVSDSTDVLNAYSRYPDRVIPFRGPDGLDLDNPSTLDLIRTDLDTGSYWGLGEIVTRHGFYSRDNPADHPLMLDAWDLGREYDIPVTVHMGTRPLGENQTALPAQWLAEFERALQQNPSTIFIWSHCGPSSPQVLRGMLDRHPNLYADLSALNPVFHEMRGREHPELVIDGPEWIGLLEAYSNRVFFGTDAYFQEGYESYSSLVAYVRYQVLSQLAPQAAQDISYRNAERLLGISSSPK